MLTDYVLQNLVAIFILSAIIIYALLGGADFGGGIWDLFASGKRKNQQRALIEQAIGPIWEANHVWLIIVLVLLFTCFPVAFSRITTSLHLPLTLILLCIIFRGVGFVFRHYSEQQEEITKGRWGRVFACSSVIAPILYGMIVGAIIKGLPEDRSLSYSQLYIEPWLSPLPLALGLLTLALWSILSAFYLAVETTSDDLQDDFRARGLAAQAFGGVIAVLSLLLSAKETPWLYYDLSKSWWSMPLIVIQVVAALLASYFLFKRKFVLARTLAVLQVILVLVGWALAQFPFLVYPDLTLRNAATDSNVLELVLIVLLGGGALLLPSIYYLMKIFKGKYIFRFID